MIAQLSMITFFQIILSSWFMILYCVDTGVTIDRVWIGEQIYQPLTYDTQNCK
jgi:hypothetical protein